MNLWVVNHIFSDNITFLEVPKLGGPLAVLQKALGHSTLAVTERYVHLGDKDILDAYVQHSPAASISV